MRKIILVLITLVNWFNLNAQSLSLSSVNEKSMFAAYAANTPRLQPINLDNFNSNTNSGYYQVKCELYKKHFSHSLLRYETNAAGNAAFTMVVVGLLAGICGGAELLGNKISPPSSPAQRTQNINDGDAALGLGGFFVRLGLILGIVSTSLANR